MSNLPVILYDPQIFDLQNYGGISRYFANLISGINKGSELAARLPVIYSTNYYLRDFPQFFNNVLGAKLLKKQSKRSKWNIRYSSRQIKKSDYSILHTTYYDPYFLQIQHTPLVITIHDMIYENHPELFPDSSVVINQKKLSIDAADVIIAISKYTAEQIIKFYPESSHKIKMIYHGISDRNTAPANESLPDKFLLYVGDRYAQYKNFSNFLKASAAIIRNNKDLQLICAGGGPFTPPEVKSIEDFGISENIIQLNATDQLIVQLYRQALLFIYPSIEEGFGIPMLEAFKNGCPVACSNSSCFPEVGGDAAIYFNPQEVTSIQQAILNVLENDGFRLQHIDAGYRQVQLFPFSKCLAQTIDVYKSLLADKARQE